MKFSSTVAAIIFSAMTTQAFAASAPTPPNTPAPTTRLWLIGDTGYSQMQGKKAGSNVIRGANIQALGVLDLIKIKPNFAVSCGGGLSSFYGGYSSTENQVETKLSLMVFAPSAVAGVTYTNPKFVAQTGLAFHLGVFTSLNLEITETSLYETNNYSATNNLKDYARADIFARAFTRISPKLWLGGYAAHTLSGTLTAKSVPSESFESFQVGLSVSMPIDFVARLRSENTPKPFNPKLPPEEIDPLKGIDE